jgi:CRP-like cAMP-binding protein
MAKEHPIAQLESRINTLENMPIFQGVDREVITAISGTCSVVEISSGSYFFHEGEPASSMYILERGHAAVYRAWQNSQIRLRELREGDCFGEVALLDHQPRSATVQALSYCEAIRIRQAQLTHIKAAYPAAYIDILLNIGRVVCQRLRDADDGLFAHEMKGH